MTTTEDKPVDREAWRRLLDGGDDGPPELTDARIRAKARQALTPTTGRWWLPASLAASMLLAVVLVQRQYERPRATSAVVTESDYAAAPAEAPAAALPEQALRDEIRQREDWRPADAAAAVAPEREVARERSELKENSRNFTPDPPVVPPPQIDLPATSDSRVLSGVIASQSAVDPTPAPAAPAPAASAPAATAEAKREEDVGEIVVTGSRRREGSLESTTPTTQVTSADVTSQGMHSGALMKSDKAERTPEEWYAEIEKLRAAGKKREAKRELKKLEEVHPGWLEMNHPTER